MDNVYLLIAVISGLFAYIALLGGSPEVGQVAAAVAFVATVLTFKHYHVDKDPK